MASTDFASSPLVRMYAIAAVFGLAGGWLGFFLSVALTGHVHPLALGMLACSLPVIPVAAYYGTGVFGSRFANVFAGFRGSSPARGVFIALAVGIIACAGLLGVWVSIRESAGRDRVREFASKAVVDAQVIVDGMSQAEGRALLPSLADLKRGRPPNSHNLRRFPVLIRSGGETLDLDLARDSERPRVYWVFLPGMGWETDYNAVGHLETPLLDAVESSGSRKPRRERR